MVLFITRKFPPSTGGMETVAFELSRHLSKITEVKLIKWGGSNRWLPLILPYLLLKSLWFLSTTRVSLIYLQDGLLAPLGVLLKIFRKPVVITIHGKDITYDSAIYQFLIQRFVRKMDRVICVSTATANECVKRGVSQDKITVIPNGISDDLCMNGERQNLRVRLAERLGIHQEKRILLSVGRLVERKGIHWFVTNVLAKLIEECSDCVYLIVGDGSYTSKIRRIIEENKLETSVFMMGSVDNETLQWLYNGSDIFIMPNIPVKGDIEGFGVVALEAASCALPVVASNLEGIKDAIQDGENGFLVRPGDISGYVVIIKKLLEDDALRHRFGAQARKYTIENYSWKKMARRYLEEFTKLE